MLNESVYRSPKWLKKFLDFEVHTGEDIKDKVSKRELRRIEQEKIKAAEKEAKDKAKVAEDAAKAKEAQEKKRRAKWDSIWVLRFGDTNLYPTYGSEKYQNREKFKLFYKNVYPRNYKEFNDLYRTTDFNKLKEYLRGNSDIFDEFDAWIIKKETTERQEKERYERIKRELDTLYDRLLQDFLKNPYRDKFDIRTKNGKNDIFYHFENGAVFEIYEREIVYEDYASKTNYSVGLLYQAKFINLISKLMDHRKSRPGGPKVWGGKKHKPSTGDPNRDKYNTLKEKIKLRQEHLDKMKKTDKDYEALKNELDNYKRAAEKFRQQYKFENLVNFNNFGVS